MMSLITFKNVDIVFGDSPEAALPLIDAGKNRAEILEQTGNVLGACNANLSIQEGEICVLMGLSGSGKSTLLRAINGLNKVVRGELLLDHEGQAVDIAACDKKLLREIRLYRVAMVFQQFALLPWLTVAENVGFGLEMRGMPKAERQKIIDEKLDMVGLTEWKNKFARELSGGMQQRVGLARAFATDADILLMDEPFSALDPLIRDKLQDDLLELQAKLKKTIVFVSHDLDEAIKLGNHIAIMEGGRIVQYGTPEDIVLNPVNQYVADFVAHMNPLNVLTAQAIMTKTADLSANENGAFNVDWSGQHQIRLTAENHVEHVSIADKTATLTAWHEELDVDKAAENAYITATPTTLLRDLIRIRHATGRPAIILQDNCVVGVVGGNEIYEGMLRQNTLSAQFQSTGNAKL